MLHNIFKRQESGSLQMVNATRTTRGPPCGPFLFAFSPSREAVFPNCQNCIFRAETPPVVYSLGYACG